MAEQPAGTAISNVGCMERSLEEEREVPTTALHTVETTSGEVEECICAFQAQSRVNTAHAVEDSLEERVHQTAEEVPSAANGWIARSEEKTHETVQNLSELF